MPETLDTAPRTRPDDLEFLRKAGISPDLAPHPSAARLAVLAAALLLAGATGLAAAAFSSAGVTGGGAGFEACATQCPGMAPPAGG